MDERINKKIAKLLFLTEKQINIVCQNYGVDQNQSKDFLFAIIDYYFRSTKFSVKPGFKKEEWAILSLFYGLGMDLKEISKMIKLPNSQTKLHFFSAKQKLKDQRINYEM